MAEERFSPSCAPDYSRLSQLLLFQDLLFEAHLLCVMETALPAGACGDERAHGSSKEAIKIAVALSKVHLSKSDLQVYIRQHPFAIV